MLGWTCARCTLENEGREAECAACGGRRPREAELSEEEQLEMALALSKGDARKPHNVSDGSSGLHTVGVASKWGPGGYAEGCTAAPAGRSHGRPGLSSEEEEELLVAQSNVAPALRNDPLVAAHALRVAGDSRGTASALVGLTPEEELELAMLKSKVAHEQPEVNSPPPRCAGSAATSVATVGLRHASGGMAPAYDANAPLQLPTLVPLVAPPRRGAGSVGTGRAGTLQEGLLGGEFPLPAEGTRPPSETRGSSGARKQRAPPPYAANVPYQPPSVPLAPPFAPPALATTTPLAPAIPGYEDDDAPPFSTWEEDPAEEWDDADRPLEAVPAPPSPDNARQGLLAAERSAQAAASIRPGGGALTGGYANLMD